MKRTAWAGLILAFALLVCACGNDAAPTDPTNTATNNATATQVGYSLTYHGVHVGVGMAMDQVRSQLGTPKDQYTSESCAFGGQDTVYYYDSLQVSTNDEQGYERIYALYLEDDLVATEEGVCVGDSAEKVTSVYGAAGAESTASNLVYAKDGMTLSFRLQNGVVASILYNMGAA